MIRRVFLRWSREMVTEGYLHPEPVGLLNDPALFADRRALRNAGNNYFGSHLRNVGMMAMALDPADDPGGELGRYRTFTPPGGADLIFTDRVLYCRARRRGLAVHLADPSRPPHRRPMAIAWCSTVATNPMAGPAPGREHGGNAGAVPHTDALRVRHRDPRFERTR